MAKDTGRQSMSMKRKTKSASNGQEETVFQTTKLDRRQRVDLVALARLTQDCGDDFHLIVKDFIRDTRARALRIVEAAKLGDQRVLRYESHTLVGSAAMFALVELSAMASHIEKACDTGNDERSIKLIAGLPTLTEESLSILEKQILS